MATHISVVNLTPGTALSPGAQAITVPADATGVAVFWYTYVPEGNPYSLGLSSSFTSGGLTIKQSADATSLLALVGVARGLVTATGSQTITPVWSTSTTPISDGPLMQVAFFKDIDTGDWYRDSDHNNTETGTAATTTSTPAIDTGSTDLVYTFVSGYDAINTPSGMTSRGTTGLVNNAYGGVFTIDSPGASTTTPTSGTQDYPAIAAISIKSTGGGGPTIAPLASRYYSMLRSRS